MESESRKSWTNEYPSITRLRVHSFVQADGSVLADFDSVFPPPDTDEEWRLGEAAFPPNGRVYRLYSEEDGVTWFNSEVSSIVLAAFQRFPLVTQQSHHPAKGDSTKVVDSAYTMDFGGRKTNLVIGEFKRNLIRPDQWQINRLGGNQITLSKELRGYAHHYECPQVFCFDHKTLLILQFRAHTIDEIRGQGDVDCWILPRYNPGGTAWRYALYRLLVQGFRRFQGLHRRNPILRSLPAEKVVLYNGQPQWRVDGRLTYQPWGYTRILDRSTGTFYWTDETGTMLVDDRGIPLADTVSLWGSG